MPSEQKVAVRTGASRGIGACLGRGFRNIGYGVVATSRSMRKINAAGDPAVLVIDGNIAASSTAERIVCKAIERFGRIDALVNNAGVFIPSRSSTIPKPASWR
jgi:NAD(P)-dependent dehydrogenase (short-subunit alcohol dehydrogenase family)